MEAENWKELDFLLKTAGLTAEQIMGLDEDFSEDESSMPSPKTFRENLKLQVMGEEIEIPFPDMNAYEVYGTEDVKLELCTPPPFMDMEKLLRPEPIPPETVEEVKRLAAHLEGKSTADLGASPDGHDDEEFVVKVKSKMTVPPHPVSTHPHPVSIPPHPVSAPLQLKTSPAVNTQPEPRRPLKRHRSPSGTDTDLTPDLEQTATATVTAATAMGHDDPASIIVPSSSSSSGEDPMEDSVIDLTQE